MFKKEKINNLIKLVKSNKIIYPLVRGVYYFFISNKLIGKLIWFVCRHSFVSKRIVYEKCLCGENIYSIYVNFGKHKIVACKKCGLLRNFPKPTTGVYERVESLEYENNPDVSIQVINYIIDLKNKFNSDANILDFGCGDGRIMESFISNGFKNVFGLEVSSYLANKAKNKGLLVFSSISEIQNNLFFDVVIANHVFEHIEKLSDVLNDLSKFLKNDSTVLVFVPNIRSNRMHNFYRNFLWDSHYWQFSPDTLKDFFEANNFRVINCETAYDSNNKKLFIEKPNINGNEGDVICISAKKINL
jgi:SAM-dependent methyltransferase